MRTPKEARNRCLTKLGESPAEFKERKEENERIGKAIVGVYVGWMLFIYICVPLCYVCIIALCIWVAYKQFFSEAAKAKKAAGGSTATEMVHG